MAPVLRPRIPKPAATPKAIPKARARAKPVTRRTPKPRPPPRSRSRSQPQPILLDNEEVNEEVNRTQLDVPVRSHEIFALESHFARRCMPAQFHKSPPGFKEDWAVFDGQDKRTLHLFTYLATSNGKAFFLRTLRSNIAILESMEKEIIQRIKIGERQIEIMEDLLMGQKDSDAKIQRYLKIEPTRLDRERDVHWRRLLELELEMSQRSLERARVAMATHGVVFRNLENGTSTAEEQKFVSDAFIRFQEMRQPIEDIWVRVLGLVQDVWHREEGLSGLVLRHRNEIYDIGRS